MKNHNYSLQLFVCLNHPPHLHLMWFIQEITIGDPAAKVHKLGCQWSKQSPNKCLKNSIII
tara:strand:+ start:4084 stop:4266 length:183 start_codon:yes stop_codon:yes gene_type:complete